MTSAAVDEYSTDLPHGQSVEDDGDHPSALLYVCGPDGTHRVEAHILNSNQSMVENIRSTVKDCVRLANDDTRTTVDLIKATHDTNPGKEYVSCGETATAIADQTQGMSMRCAPGATRNSRPDVRVQGGRCDGWCCSDEQATVPFEKRHNLSPGERAVRVERCARRSGREPMLDRPADRLVELVAAALTKPRTATQLFGNATGTPRTTAKHMVSERAGRRLQPLCVANNLPIARKDPETADPPAVTTAVHVPASSTTRTATTPTEQERQDAQLKPAKQTTSKQAGNCTQPTHPGDQTRR